MKINMKNFKMFFYIITMHMLISCNSNHTEIVELYIKLPKSDIDMYGCLKEDSDKIRINLIDDKYLTETYLEFSEPCNGANCALALLENEQNKYLLLKGHEININSKNAGIKIYLIREGKLSLLEKDLIFFDKEKTDEYIKNHPDYKKIFKVFNGSIPYEIKLPKEGNELELFINEDFLNQEISITSFGKFTFKDEMYIFLYESL